MFLLVISIGCVCGPLAGDPISVAEIGDLWQRRAGVVRQSLWENGCVPHWSAVECAISGVGARHLIEQAVHGTTPPPPSPTFP